MKKFFSLNLKVTFIFQIWDGGQSVQKKFFCLYVTLQKSLFYFSFFACLMKLYLMANNIMINWCRFQKTWKEQKYLTLQKGLSATMEVQVWVSYFTKLLIIMKCCISFTEWKRSVVFCIVFFGLIFVFFLFLHQK